MLQRDTEPQFFSPEGRSNASKFKACAATSFVLEMFFYCCIKEESSIP